MKKFVVHLSNKQRHLMTEELVKAHAAYLKSLKEKGVLPFCGPCADGTGLMIIDAASYEEAKGYVDNDPFSKVDYYIDRKLVEVEEATIENNFLIDDVVAYLSKSNK
ncbi:YciI family protein [Paenibacillus puldeungensis]|uniref:YciI family protein n=1 Tax=Paenibacillus puldeungensis TaxID=696536 RepID=A0ABW3RTS4_9BACL